ncbi:hypothetical protein [Nocardia beijingensis]
MSDQHWGKSRRRDDEPIPEFQQGRTVGAGAHQSTDLRNAAGAESGKFAKRYRGV